MTNNDPNNSSEPEEDHTIYKHAASEIEALRAILKKRKKDKNAENFDKDENKNKSDEKGEKHQPVTRNTKP